jgi:hypothetical protein
LVDMSESSGATADRRGFLKYAGAAAAVGLRIGRYAGTPESGRTVTQTVIQTATLTKSVAEDITVTSVYLSSLRSAAEASKPLRRNSAENGVYLETSRH